MLQGEGRLVRDTESLTMDHDRASSMYSLIPIQKADGSNSGLGMSG
jgi:hypothetical protein